MLRTNILINQSRVNPRYPVYNSSQVELAKKLGIIADLPQILRTIRSQENLRKGYEKLIPN